MNEKNSANGYLLGKKKQTFWTESRGSKVIR